MRHLVLGSEGQIGKYVCDEIEKNGDEAIHWDVRLEPRMDLRDFYYLTNSMNGGKDHSFIDMMGQCDFVHFLAYDVGGSTYLAKNQDSYDYIGNNVSIMQNVFECLKATKKPFYFASSQMSNMTDSVYGQLKAVGESYTKALGGINLQFWNIYGYESDPEKTHVITDFIKMALKDGKILCRTNGNEIRNWTHAADAARMLHGASNHFDELKESVGYWSSANVPLDTYPLASRPNLGYSIRHVAQTIVKILGEDMPIYYTDKPDTTQTIVNMIDHDALMKLHQIAEFNNRDAYDLEHGIKDVIDRIRADG